MDDPIFEPWSTQTPPWTERTPRWRSPAGTGPTAGTRRTLESGHVDVLLASVMPRLMKLSARLQVERHETVIDERLDQATPSLRMRLRPWRAPFTGPQAAAGSVLEILLSQGPTPEILGRLCIGSDSTAPTHQIRVEVSKLTDAWLDRLLLDFVERALR